MRLETAWSSCERLRKAEALIAAAVTAVEEVRYDIPPARRITIEGSIIAVLRDGVEAGVAFFVSPTKALTVAHNLRTPGNRHLRI